MFRFYFLLISAFFTFQASAQRCAESLSRIENLRKDIQDREDTKAEQRRTFDEYLAPGKILSSSIFQKAILQAEREDGEFPTVENVLKTFFEQMSVGEEASEAGDKSYVRSTHSLNSIAERAKELGLSVKEFLEFSDLVADLKNSPEKLADFKKVLETAVPHLWNIASKRQHFSTEHHYSNDGFGIAAIGSFFGGGAGLMIGMFSMPMEIDVGYAAIVGGAAGLTLGPLASIFSRWIGLRAAKLKELTFEKFWKGEDKASDQVAREVANHYNIKPHVAQPRVKVDVSKPYEAVSKQLESPKIKFEGATNDSFDSFGQDLQSRTHKFIEEAASRFVPIAGPERWAALESNLENILKQHSARKMNKLEASQLLRPLLERKNLLAKFDNRNLSSMRSDLEAIETKLNEAREEIENAQLVMLTKLDTPITGAERIELEEHIAILDQRKEALVGDYLSLQPLRHSLEKLKSVVENHQQFAGAVQRSLLSSGDFEDQKLSAVAVEGLTKLHATAKKLRTEGKLEAVEWNIAIPQLNVESILPTQQNTSNQTRERTQ